MASEKGDPAILPVREHEIAILRRIERRLLWLSTYSIHYANHVRPNPSGLKVGGHQASSSSVVSLMTAMYFRWLRSGDRLAIKPHASPVLHAAHALRGDLPMERLKELRAFHGLQAYPSRSKDPFPVDFSTGSLGLRRGGEMGFAGCDSPYFARQGVPSLLPAIEHQAHRSGFAFNRLARGPAAAGLSAQKRSGRRVPPPLRGRRSGLPAGCQRGEPIRCGGPWSPRRSAQPGICPGRESSQMSFP